MRRTLFLAALVFGGVMLPGCPIYPSDSCYDDSDCSYGYSCGGDSVCYPNAPTPVPSTGGSGSTGICRSPDDCSTNQTCTPASSSSPGVGLCVPGDCTWSPCVSGYTCGRSAQGKAVCLPDGNNQAGYGGSGQAGSANTAGTSNTAGTGAVGGEAGSGTAGLGGAGGAAGDTGTAGTGEAGGAGGAAGDTGTAGAGGEPGGSGQAGDGASAGAGQAGDGSSAGSGQAGDTGIAGSSAAGGATSAGGASAAGAAGDTGTAGTGGAAGDTGTAGAAGAAPEACSSGGLGTATGSVDLAGKPSWCIGGLTSSPDTTTVAVAGGYASKGEQLSFTISGQSASSSTVTCNDGTITCSFKATHDEGGVPVRYESTAGKPFTVQVVTWTSGSFLGLAQGVQAVRSELSTSGSSQVVDGLSILVKAN